MMTRSRFTLLLLVMLAVFATCGCGGCHFERQAQDNVLFPAATGAWDTGIEEDVRAGLQVALSDGDITPEQFDAFLQIGQQIDAAVAAGDRTAFVTLVAPNWPQMRQFAVMGIQSYVDNGELSDKDFDGDGIPDMVESFLFRLDTFQDALTALGGTVPAPSD